MHKIARGSTHRLEHIDARFENRARFLVDGVLARERSNARLFSAEIRLEDNDFVASLSEVLGRVAT